MRFRTSQDFRFLTPSPSSSKKATQPIRVCVVAWQAATAVFPVLGRNVGGMETAGWLLARGLAGRDSVECAFVMRADQPFERKQVDDVDLVVDVDPRQSIRRAVSKVFEDGFRNAMGRLRPRLLWQIPYLAVTWPTRRPDPKPCEPDPRLAFLRPDIWIAMGVNRESAGVIATANNQSRPAVLMIQSNADLDARYASDPTFRSRYGESSQDCRFAIERADQIVCQTNDQLRMLRESFQRDGVVIRNAIEIDCWSHSHSTGCNHVLWIGRYDDFHKRPQLAMQIAARCPEIPFRMIINPSDDAVRRRLQQFCPANVTIDEYVPADQMPATMAACRLFLSTGSAQHEGFPNVLLQATASGKPIVSLDDFDGFLTNSGAGVVCHGDVERAAATIATLWSNQQVLDSERAQAYLKDHHALDQIIDELIELFGRVIQVQP